MLQNIIDETLYISYRLSSPSTYLQLTHSQSQPQNIFIFINTLRHFFSCARSNEGHHYQILINRPGRDSLGSRPSHAISLKSCRFFWPREFLNSFNTIHRGELPLTLNSGSTEDQGRNTIIKLPKIAYNSFSKVWIQLIWYMKSIFIS